MNFQVVLDKHSNLSVSKYLPTEGGVCLTIVLCLHLFVSWAYYAEDVLRDAFGNNWRVILHSPDIQSVASRHRN